MRSQVIPIVHGTPSISATVRRKFTVFSNAIGMSTLFTAKKRTSLRHRSICVTVIGTFSNQRVHYPRTQAFFGLIKPSFTFRMTTDSPEGGLVVMLQYA